MPSAMHKVWPRLLLALLFAGQVCPQSRLLFAQDEDEATEPAEEPAEEAPADEPVPGVPARRILPNEPKTPEEVFEGVLILVDLGRPDAARPYLERFLKDEPSSELILQLREQHGPAAFLKLSNIKELQPLSTRLLEMSNAAFKRYANDPQRLQGLIKDLGGNADEQAVAVDELSRAGEIVVPTLLAALKSPAAERIRDELVYTIVRMGNRAVPPLLAAVASPDPEIQSYAIKALGYIGSSEAIPYLWYPAIAPEAASEVRATARLALTRLIHGPGRTEVGSLPLTGVVTQLRKAALNYLDPAYPWPRDEQGQVPFWTWDTAAENIRLVHVTPQVASSVAGMRFARQALALNPADRDIHVMYLTLALANEVYAAGWKYPLPSGPGTAHDLALAAGEDVVTRVVADALEQARPAAVLAGLKVLGQIGSPRLLISTDGRRSPVLAALEYPDHRIQFAAASTVMQIDPTTRFRGSGRVVQVFARALADAGEGARSTMVIDANSSRGQTVIGMLGDLGYQGVLATTGRDGFTAATERPDLNAILIHANVIRWDLGETLANLRADSRTAGIPILVLGSPEIRPRIETYLRRFKLLTLIDEPLDTAQLESQFVPYLAALHTPPLSPEERQGQASAAAYWLAHIGTGKRSTIFDLKIAEPSLTVSLDNPELAQNALLALGATDSRTSQMRLAEVVTGTSFDLPVRETAALQLAFHIQKHGLMIGEDDVKAIHKLWSSPQDPSFGTALGSVIGSLAPDRELVGQRLRAYRDRNQIAPAPEAVEAQP